MVKMFEVKIEVLAHPNFTIDDIKSNIKDSLDVNINIDLTHIRVKISEKKHKNWIIDSDRKSIQTEFKNYDLDGNDKEAYLDREREVS